MSVVDCNDFTGKELHRQVGVGTVMTLGILGSVMVSTLPQNPRRIGSIPALGAVFSHSITPTTAHVYTESDYPYYRP